jgi:hypothetical protein
MRDVDGLPAIWHRRLTDSEWSRIRRKRRYGPARTLLEFWDIVREDLRSELALGERIDVTTVVLDSDDHERLEILVGNRRSRAFTREMTFLWIDLGPRRSSIPTPKGKLEDSIE